MKNEKLINTLKMALEKCEIERKYRENEFNSEFDILLKEKEELIDQAIIVKETNDEKYLELSLKLQEVENKIKELTKKKEKKLKCVNVDVYLALRGFCNNLIEVYSNSIKEKHAKLEEIKAQIMNCVSENKFDEVDKLTLEASKVNEQIEEVILMLKEIEEFNSYIKNCETVEFEAIGKNILDGSFKIGGLNVDTIVQSENKVQKEETVQEEKEEPIKSQLDIAREIVEKVKQTRKFKDLKVAFEEVDKLPESAEKQALLNELEEMVKEVKLQEATRLVEEAEKTLKEEDALKAKEIVLKLDDGKEKEELLNRVNVLIKTINEEFSLLLEELTHKVNKGENINRKEVIKLNNLYSGLDFEDLTKYESSVKNIVEYYNNSVQDEQKENYGEKDVNKYGKLAFATELLGIGLNKVLSSKLANKIRVKKIEKNNKKLENESLSDKKKGSISKKIEKSSKNIADSSLVSGVRLFAARNKIASMKPVLYKDGLEEYDKQSFDSARSRLVKIINKNINKKSKDKAINDNKEMMVNLLEQYSEMLSVCDDYGEKYDEAIEALKGFKGNLDEATYNAYEEQFYMIANYRDYSDGEIYELSENEIDNIKTYFDSEEYKKSNVKTHYVK